jgi:hypothetical protein
MAVNFGKMIGDIEQNLFHFANDPLSIFDGVGLTKKDQDRVAGIRAAMPSPPRVTPATGRPVSPGVAAPAAADGGPVTININITVYPNGVVAGVGAGAADAGQPQPVVVAPPPDMRKQAGQSMAQAQSARPSQSTARKVVKRKPTRPGR